MAVQVDPFTAVAFTVIKSAELNARFNPLYNLQNGNIDSANMDLSANFAWTGTHSFISPTITGTVAGGATYTAPTITSPTITGPSTYNSGADINVYSDVATTLKFAVDGATGDVQSAGTAYVGTLSEGQVFNGGISVSGSTFTITQADGSAITAAKPLFVGVKSNTAGRVVLAKFTAPVSFTFGAASDTDGNLFGITNADWSNVMPFFLGVIYDGTTPYFTISRVPSYVSGAAATDLAQKGDTDADAQTDVMILATGLTLANWVNLPITQVGWFQMTYATAGGAWTASTSIHTGFNKEYEKINFTFPLGQNGSSATTYIVNNGGTSPVFLTNDYIYRIKSNGECTVVYNLDSDGGTDGVGANIVSIATPYIKGGATTFFESSVALIEILSTVYAAFSYVTTAESQVQFLIPTLSGSNLQNVMSHMTKGQFTNGVRVIDGSITYQVI